MLRNKFLSRERILLTHSVRPSLQTWPKKKLAELVVGNGSGVCKAGLTMPHPEEICGIAVEIDTLFGGLPQGKKPPESVTRRFFSLSLETFVSTNLTHPQRVLSSSSSLHTGPDTERIDRSTALS